MLLHGFYFSYDLGLPCVLLNQPHQEDICFINYSEDPNKSLFIFISLISLLYYLFSFPGLTFGMLLLMEVRCIPQLLSAFLLF